MKYSLTHTKQRCNRPWRNLAVVAVEEVVTREEVEVGVVRGLHGAEEEVVVEEEMECSTRSIVRSERS